MDIQHSNQIIKINAVVDDAVVPLVQALNEMNYILTLDSCQGNDDEQAYVYFKIADNNEDKLPKFCQWLAKKLYEYMQTNHSNTCLRIDWTPDFSTCMAKISTEKNNVTKLSEAISAIFNENRKTGSFDGKKHKGPHSSQDHQNRQHSEKQHGDIPHCTL